LAQGRRYLGDTRGHFLALPGTQQLVKQIAQQDGVFRIAIREAGQQGGAIHGAPLNFFDEPAI
jgi:hypothetical protein